MSLGDAYMDHAGAWPPPPPPSSETIDDLATLPADRHRLAHEAADARLFTAAHGPRPTEEQFAAVDALRAAAVEMGAALELYATPGRNKSLAWTALEDVLMRANRSIFAPEETR